MTGLPLAAEDNQPTSVPRQELSLEERFWSGDLPVALDMTTAKSASAVPRSPTAIMADWAYTVYQSYRDGNWEIYLAHDGQEFRLTNNVASDARPRLNRGSTKVAFNSNRDGNYEIYTMNVDGSNLRRLTYDTASDSAPAWSPDGTKIAFMSKRDGNYEIYVMNADGSSQTRLTYLSSTEDVTPVWSPDGSQIAWVQENGSYGAINAMNANGSGQHQILGGQPYLADAQWSPAGNRFAFDSIPNPNSSPFSGISVVNADGSGLRTAFFGGLWVDYWTGSWMTDAANVMYTRVEYVIQNNQVYLGAAYVESNNVDNPTTTARYTSSGLDMNPDRQTADLQPPRSRVNPLPTYSRSAGTTVSWSGSDSGVAGIASYDVQYRIGTAGAWTDWQMNTADTSATFVGSSGQTIYFRSRARDNAGNGEAWPSAADGDASTTLYRYQLTGSVIDNRGAFLPQVSIPITPAALNPIQTDSRGNYLGLLIAEGAHVFSAGHTGYGSIPTTGLDANRDLVRTFYLPPLDNVIQNGSFETDNQTLTGWTVQGTLTPTVTNASHGLGAQAASLAFTCPISYPCLSPSEDILGGSYSYPDLFVTADGTVHLVQLSGGGLTYTYRTPQGTWSTPEIIANVASYAPALAVDQSGTVHAVWPSSSDANGSSIYYRQRSPAGIWSTPVVVGSGTEPDLAVDSRGGLHLVYRNSQLIYQERSPAGTWSAPLALASAYSFPGIAVGSNDTVHIIWQQVSDGIYYRARLTDGTWTTPEQLFSGFGYTFDPQRIAVDATGRVHAFWDWAYSGYYATRDPDGSWSAPQVLPKARGWSDMAVDSEGTVYLISTSSIGTEEGIWYRMKPAAGSWLDPVFLSSDYNWYAQAITVDPSDVMHMVWKTSYQTLRRSDHDDQLAIGQTLSLPVDAHQPTLAFAYKLSGGSPTNGQGMVVKVLDSITTTSVFSSSRNGEWSLAWVDLHAWAGQTITVEFALQQKTGGAYPHLLLDDVSLGSWLTPLISGIAPNQIEAHASTGITITGDNFILTPTVRFNEIPAANVLFIDAHTLQVTVPASLPPGRYDIWVTNPGGQESTLSRGLLVGREVFLPMVQK